MIRIALIGAGRMGGAMLRGWRAAAAHGEAAWSFVVVDPQPDADLQALAAEGAVQLNPDPLLIGPVDVLVCAVKPQTFSAASADMRLFVGRATIVLSIMAGVSIAALADKLGADRVARAMPNTPGAIGRGVTSVVFGADLSPADKALTERLLEPLGHIETLESEKLMDAATAVAGCGPAYVFLLAEVMAKAGEAEGLEPAVAMRLAIETIAGSGALMTQSQEEPAALRRAVTSPQGVTAVALDALMENGGMAALFRRAFAKAIQRSRELGREASR
jgi:pyrroline-5-carboxylate reductase